jgi:hypothetical protein
MGPERMQLLGITDPNQLKDPAINAKAALMLLRGKLGGAGGYQHWSDYKNGKYRQYLDQAEQGLKSKVVESTVSPAEIMPYQSTGDLFNPNPTTSTAASFQPVPFEKSPVVSAGVSSGRGTKNETLDERFAYNAVGSGRGAPPPGFEPNKDITLPSSLPEESKKAGSWTPDKTVPYSSWSSGDDRAAKVAYVNTPAETLGTFRATYPEENVMAPKPEAPAPTAPAITPPSEQTQANPYGELSRPQPTSSLMDEPTFGRNSQKMEKAGFDIDGPSGDVLSFYTTRPHKAFLYLTPDMKTPNIGIGGQ